MWNNAKEISSRKKKIYGALIVVLIIVFVLIGYTSGYRFKSNFTIGKVGTVSIHLPLPLTSVYIDESRKISTTKKDETIVLKLSPNKHSVIVARDGYFPWKKDFIVQSNTDLKLLPIFVTQNASGQIITEKDPEYKSIRNKFLEVKLPTKNTPKISSDNTTTLWLEDNKVLVEDKSGIKTVIQPDTILRNVDFYKDRSDVLIISTNNSVYAIEVAEEGQQNFMPIYKGQSPSFVVQGINSIYVLDAENLMEVII